MIGPHIIGPIGEHRELLSRWQPRAALILDPGSGAAGQIKAWSPHTFLVGRVFRPDNEIDHAIQQDPEAAAVHAAALVRHVAQQNREVDVWQYNNEVVQDNPEVLAKLARFSMRYIDLLAADNLRAAIGGFSVGKPEAPELDGGAAWQAYMPALRHGLGRGAVLLLHAYGAPRIFDADPSFLLHRYEQRVRPHLPADVRDMPYVYGEYGCDMGVKNPGDRSGWRTGYANDHRLYAEDLRRAADLLAAQSCCLGACIFTLGSMGGWGDFEIMGDAAWQLAQTDWPMPQPGSTPVDGTPLDLSVTVDARLRDLLVTTAAARQAVRFNPESALQKRIFADGLAPNSAEFTVEVVGRSYQVQRAEHPATGEVRAYYVRHGDWANVRFVRR